MEPPALSQAEPSTETASAPHWPQMTGQAVSDFFGFSPRWLSKLEEQNLVSRLPNRLFDAGAVALGYIAFLKSEDRRSSKTEQGKRKEAAQVKKIEIENAVALNKLVDIETVEATFAEIFTMLRIEMGSVPAGMTRDLELRADLEKRHNAAFDRCRAKFEAAAQALQSGVPLLDPDEEAES